MKFIVREYNPETDYPLIASWWLARAYTVPPQDLLNTYGLIACNEDGKELAATFSYHGGGLSPAGFLGWTVSNPETDVMMYTHLAVKHVAKAMLDSMKEAGVKYVLAHTDVPAIHKAYTDAGMKMGSRGTLTDYVINLEV